MNDKSYIYIIKIENKIKIWKANILINRLWKLDKIWWKIEWRDSYTIEIDKDDVFKFEQLLHFVFKKYNIDDLDKKDWYTEWFDLCIINDVIDLIKILQNHLDIKINIWINENQIKNAYLRITKDEVNNYLEEMYENMF